MPAVMFRVPPSLIPLPPVISSWSAQNSWNSLRSSPFADNLQDFPPPISGMHDYITIFTCPELVMCAHDFITGKFLQCILSYVLSYLLRSENPLRKSTYAAEVASDDAMLAAKYRTEGSINSPIYRGHTPKHVQSMALRI